MEFESGAEIIRSATIEVFQMMLGTELTPGAAFVDEKPFHQSDVMGLIGLGGAIKGYVTLHCSVDQGKAFTARLLGMQPEEVETHDEIRDAIGELVNMVAGSVKTALSDVGSVEISLPSVIIATKPEASVKDCKGIVMPFEDPSGTFHVELVVSDR